MASAVWSSSTEQQESAPCPDSLQPSILLLAFPPCLAGREGRVFRLLFLLFPRRRKQVCWEASSSPCIFLLHCLVPWWGGGGRGGLPEQLLPAVWGSGVSSVPRFVGKAAAEGGKWWGSCHQGARDERQDACSHTPTFPFPCFLCLLLFMPAFPPAYSYLCFTSTCSFLLLFPLSALKLLFSCCSSAGTNLRWPPIIIF